MIGKNREGNQLLLNNVTFISILKIEEEKEMLFQKDVLLVSIKWIGERSAIVRYRDQEEEVFFTPEEAKEFHQYISQGGDMLVPMNIKTKKLFVEVDQPWDEQELEELKEISYQKENENHE